MIDNYYLIEKDVVAIGFPCRVNLERFASELNPSVFIQR